MACLLSAPSKSSQFFIPLIEKNLKVAPKSPLIIDFILFTVFMLLYQFFQKTEKLSAKTKNCLHKDLSFYRKQPH